MSLIPIRSLPFFYALVLPCLAQTPQQGNPPINYVLSDPVVGASCKGSAQYLQQGGQDRLTVNVLTGTVSVCTNGVWAVAAIGSGLALPAGSVVNGINLTLPGTLSVSNTVTATNLIGPVAALTNRSSVCFLGDSLMIGATGSSDTVWDTVWPIQLAMKAGLRLIHNGGVSGNNTTQILARVTTDVLNYPCGTVFLDGGTNDIQQSVAFATIKANLITIVTALRAAGRNVVMSTIPPLDAQAVASVSQLNTWIHQYATLTGSTLVDVYSVVTDPTNGHYKAGYSSDGIHPYAYVYRLIAESALSAIQASIPAWKPMLPEVNTDTNNLLANALMLTGAAGVPTGWTTQFPSGTVTYALAASGTVAGINGGALTLTKVGGGSVGNHDQAYILLTSGFSVGDRILFTGKILTSGMEAGQGEFDIVLRAQTAGYGDAGLQWWPAKTWTAIDIPTATAFSIEGVVPATTAQLSLQITILGAGTGVLTVGQLGVYNLTTMNAL